MNESIAREGIGMTSLRTRRRLIDRLRNHGITSEKVLGAMEQTPRHLFVDEALAHKAYEETALPIGQNQTISQPFVVARMTELLLEGGQPIKKVLEVGTGCGYQTAILSQLVTWVFTIERIGSLQQQARQRLPGLGYRNISYLNGDGFEGWQSNQPFDGILVAAAPVEVPEKLLQQLKLGGRMVIPVGNGSGQSLRLITRTATGYEEEQREAVHFVPMLNGHKI
jgi:protein-L-isoaspartate(D-aspartate) O-methyltransferase